MMSELKKFELCDEEEYEDDYDTSDEERKEEGQTIEVGKERFKEKGGFSSSPTMATCLGSLPYWCENSKKYKIRVDDELSCIDQSHKLFRFNEWNRSYKEDYILCDFSNDAKDDDYVVFCDGSKKYEVCCCGIIIRYVKLNFEESSRTIKNGDEVTAVHVELKALNLAIKRAAYLLGERMSKTKESNILDI